MFRCGPPPGNRANLRNCLSLPLPRSRSLSPVLRFRLRSGCHRSPSQSESLSEPSESLPAFLPRLSTRAHDLEEELDLTPLPPAFQLPLLLLLRVQAWSFGYDYDFVAA